MRKNFLLLSFVVGLLTVTSLFAINPKRNIREYTIDFYNIVNGLPQNSVLAIEQTPDGYLWLGTFEGLARFDGKTFTIFDKSNTKEFLNTSIKCLLSDSRGRLWIGTPNGLLLYEGGKFTRFGEKDGLKSEFILTIYEDALNRIWFGTTKGAAYYKEGKFSSLTVDDGFPDQFVNAICGDEKGNIWFGTDSKGLSFYNNKGFFNYDINSGLTSLNIRSLLYDRENKELWVGTGGGGLLSFKEGVFTHLKKNIAHADVRSLYLDKNKTMWIATNGNGIMTLKDKQLDCLSSQSVYSDLRGRDILEDHEGSIWVGTRRGLIRLKDDFFVIYNAQNGLPVNPVRSVFEDQDKNIWIGTVGGGVTRFDGSEFFTINTSKGLKNDRVWSITQDENGAMWFGTYGGGVQRFSGNKKTSYFTGNGLNNDVVRVVFCDSKNRIWAGTNGGGVNIIENGKIKYLTISNGLSDNYIYSINEDKNHDIWIGTYSGDLNRYRNGEITVFLPPKSETKNAIWAIYPDDEGNIWMGTDHGGLIRFKDGIYKRYTVEDGMYHDQAFQILEDKKGYLWMNCNLGIYRVKKSDLDLFDKGEIDSIQCISYGKKEGINITESSGPAQPAGWLASDGRVWFATINGVVVFDSKGHSKNMVPPPLVIEELIDKRRVHNAFNKVLVAPDLRDIEIRYTALSFLNPQKVEFKYRLVGYDDDWVHAGQRREAFYTALNPGSYTFKVMAANNDGIWNEKDRSLEIELLPYFYETTLFKFLVALIIILAVYGVYRLRVFQLQKNKVRLEKEVAQRTKELGEANKELIKINKTLEYLAQYDALTQIPNRRNFVQYFEDQWRLAFRQKKYISIIIIDIDFFKLYNDNYGHLEGDKCLKEVASALKNALHRPTDFVARYGGEEFVVVLPNTEKDGAFIIAEQIRKAVLDKKIVHEFSTVLKYLTISLGYSSCIPKDDKTLNLLIRKADEALYGVKESGKNKVGYVEFDD